MNISKLKASRRPLDPRGMAHFVLPLAVIVVIAAIGTYMLVASHANPAPKLRISAAKIILSGSSVVEAIPAPTATEPNRICAKKDVNFAYAVKTNRPAERVAVISEPIDSTSGGKDLKIIGTSKTVWQLTASRKASICADKTTGKVDLSEAGKLKVEARAYYEKNCFGARCGHVTKQFPAKIIKLKVKTVRPAAANGTGGASAGSTSNGTGGASAGSQ